PPRAECERLQRQPIGLVIGEHLSFEPADAVDVEDLLGGDPGHGGSVVANALSMARPQLVRLLHGVLGKLHLVVGRVSPLRVSPLQESFECTQLALAGVLGHQMLLNGMPRRTSAILADKSIAPTDSEAAMWTRAFILSSSTGPRGSVVANHY